MGALAKPRHPSAKQNVITITVDEFHSNSNSDNDGLWLSNGSSPSTTSANQNSESETHYYNNKMTLNQDNEQKTGMLSRSYSEVFMNNDSYVTPGADILLDPNNYDVESGKKSLKESFICEVDN